MSFGTLSTTPRWMRSSRPPLSALLINAVKSKIHARSHVGAEALNLRTTAIPHPHPNSHPHPAPVHYSTIPPCTPLAIFFFCADVVLTPTVHTRPFFFFADVVPPMLRPPLPRRSLHAPLCHKKNLVTNCGAVRHFSNNPTKKESHGRCTWFT